MTVFQNWISLVENAKKMDLARGEWLFMMSPDGAKYSRFGLWEPLGASGDILVKSGRAWGGFGGPRWSQEEPKMEPRWPQMEPKMESLGKLWGGFGKLGGGFGKLWEGFGKLWGGFGVAYLTWFLISTQNQHEFNPAGLVGRYAWAA